LPCTLTTKNVATRCVLRAQNASAAGTPTLDPAGGAYMLPQAPVWFLGGVGKGSGKKGKKGSLREGRERGWCDLGGLLPGTNVGRMPLYADTGL